MKPIEIENEEQFYHYFNQKEKPIMIDFFADWCAPCQSLMPVFEAIPEELDNEIIVLKVNIEKQQKISTTFMVRSIPTVVTLSKGQVVKGVVGAKQPIFYKEMAQNAIEKHKE